MADIFISYAREDKETAQLLADALEQHGLTVFWDRRIPAGRRFDDYIGEQLHAARCVIVVWSPVSVRSSWVREEAVEGRDRGILVPVRLKDIAAPLGFRAIQAANLIDWQGEPSHSGFKQLLDDVRVIIEVPVHVSVGDDVAEAEVKRKAEEEERERQWRRNLGSWAYTGCTNIVRLMAKNITKPVIAIVAALVVIVIVFLALPYFFSSSCEKIFEQTSSTLGAKLDPITAKGEVLIGREKLQNLTDRSEMMAMTLKTCCIAHHEGRLSNDEFLSCNQSFKYVETDLAKVATSLDEAARAKQEGKVDVVKKKIEYINDIVTAVETRSEQLQKEVTALVNRPVTPKRLTNDTKFPGVVAELTRFEDTGGMLTAEVTLRNIGQATVFVRVTGSHSDNYLLDEETGKTWEYSQIGGEGDINLEPGNTHTVWMKYKVDRPLPDHFTVAMSSLKRPFERSVPNSD